MIPRVTCWSNSARRSILKRYRTYVSHVQEWRQQFQKLESVNLRYDNQAIVNPDMEGKPKQPALTRRGDEGGGCGRGEAGRADHAHGCRMIGRSQAGV